MLKYGPWFHIAIASLVIIQCSGIGCQAQDTVQTSQQDSIYQKILELENAVNEMNRIISEKQQEDELEALFKEADRLSMQKEKQEIDVSKKYFSGVRQQQGLNPNISFGMAESSVEHEPESG